MVPIIKAARLIPILLRAGFRIVRQKGSHVMLEHVVDAARKITVPMHNGDLPRGTLLAILKQAGISVQNFLKLLGK